MTSCSLRRLQERAVPAVHAQPVRDPPHRTRRRSRNPRTACQSANPTQRRYDGLFAPTTAGARAALHSYTTSRRRKVT